MLEKSSQLVKLNFHDWWLHVQFHKKMRSKKNLLHYSPSETHFLFSVAIWLKDFSFGVHSINIFVRWILCFIIVLFFSFKSLMKRKSENPSVKTFYLLTKTRLQQIQFSLFSCESDHKTEKRQLIFSHSFQQFCNYFSCHLQCRTNWYKFI